MFHRSTFFTKLSNTNNKDCVRDQAQLLLYYNSLISYSNKLFNLFIPCLKEAQNRIVSPCKIHPVCLSLYFAGQPVNEIQNYSNYSKHLVPLETNEKYDTLGRRMAFLSNTHSISSSRGVSPMQLTLLRGERKRTIARKGVDGKCIRERIRCLPSPPSEENVVVFRSNVASVVDIIKLAVTHIAVPGHELCRHCRLMMHHSLAFNANNN